MSVLQAAYNELALTNARLREDNDRLRAALRDIPDGNEIHCPYCQQKAAIAHSALNVELKKK